jgi:hypothetical protein
MSPRLLSLTSFPSSAWERTAAKLCFASPWQRLHADREAELRTTGSQAELGNQSLLPTQKTLTLCNRSLQLQPLSLQLLECYSINSHKANAVAGAEREVILRNADQL